MVLRVVSQSCLVEEVEAQDEVVTELIEHMHVVHKFCLADFKWDWYTPKLSNLSPEATVTVLITLSFFGLWPTGNTCLNLAAVMQHKSAPVS
jgi:hypothetical protein